MLKLFENEKCTVFRTNTGGECWYEYVKRLTYPRDGETTENGTLNNMGANKSPDKPKGYDAISALAWFNERFGAPTFVHHRLDSL